MEKTYTVKVQFDRNNEDEIIFNQLLKLVKNNLTAGLPVSMGKANAKVSSVSESSE